MSDRPKASRAPNYGLFLALCATYLSANAGKRWLSVTIFRGHGDYGWANPGDLDYAQLLLATALPFFAVFALLYLATARFATSTRRLIVIALVILFATLVLELDSSWFGLSGRHLGWAEVRIFLMEDWYRTLGVRPSDVVRVIELALIHASFLALALIAAWWAGGLAADVPRQRQRASRVCAVILLAACIDTILSGERVAARDPQWIAFDAHHPLRSSAIDRLVGHVMGVGDEMAVLNRRLQSIAPAPERPRPNPLVESIDYHPAGHPDIVILAIEGLNVEFSRQLRTLTRLTATGISATQHYSTGDATQDGILGITHGMPMLFYGDGHYRQSPYIDALNQAGYATRRFGYDVSSFGEIDAYTRNFSEPMDVPDTAADLLMDVHNYLASGSRPKLAMIYYYWTHWPYDHDAAHQRHQPETPENFDFERWDLIDYRTQIKNRYLNSLEDMDDWLARFIAQIDLDHTIVVITGDHGEEMFEGGRMSHAGGVWKYQLRVPLVLLLPGHPPQVVDQLTSHSHLLPAISRWLDLPVRAPASILDGPLVLSAHNNQAKSPVEWGLVTPKMKLRLDMPDPDNIEITAATDHADFPLMIPDPDREPDLTDALRTLKRIQLEWKSR